MLAQTMILKSYYKLAVFSRYVMDFMLEDNCRNGSIDERCIN